MIVSEEVRRIERKLERINRTARFVRWKPQPPREVGFSDGLLSWKPPEEPLGTTHYRIYKNNENNLVRQVPVGQLQIEDNLVAERIFISSWNEPAGKESRLVQLGERVTPGGTVGNVSINNAVVTWEDVDGNGNIDLKATVSYDAPDPLGSFDRVRVYIERSDGTIVGGETDFPYDGTDPETVYTFTAPPEASDTWRVYVLSGSATAWNRLVLYGSANATPSYEILVGPPPEGSSGSEWTSNVSSLTASVEYAVTVVGDLVFRIYGTYVEPSDPTYYGARMVGRYDGDDFQLSYEPRGNTAYTSRWYPVPDVSQNWTIYAQSQGPDYRFNSIIPGTTPSASVTIQDQVGVGGLDLTRVNISTFNTDEFEIDPTEGFQVNILNATKIQTGILKVGGGSNKPGQMGVFDGSEQMIGWIGQNGAYYGGWLKQLWVGGTDPSTAPLYTNSSGQLFIKSNGTYDPSIEISDADTTVKINTTDGLKVVGSSGDYLVANDGVLFMIDATGVLGTNKMSYIEPQTISVQHSVVVSNKVGAVMESFNGYGDVHVSDTIGNTSVWMHGGRSQLILRDTFATGTAPPANYAALGNVNDDAYWYDEGTASWRRLAYADELAAILPVDDDTAVVYKTGASSIELRFDITNFSADRTITFPNASGAVPMIGQNTTVTGLWTFSSSLTTNNIEPSSDNTHEIGNASNCWAEISSARFNIVYASTNAAWSFRHFSANYLILYAPDGTTPTQQWNVAASPYSILKGDFYPWTWATYDLGTSLYTWNTGYINYLIGVDVDVSGEYKMDGTSIINSSRQFVGAGIVCTTAAAGATAFNVYQSGWYYGVTGPSTFTTTDGKTVTVRGGVIVSIV